jgi:glycosyltransferase involved in cell wall biosynthesis
LKYNKWLKKIISLILNRIRLWDRAAADRVDLFIANSKTVQKRIQKYYRRESLVIYPPVETQRFQVADLSQQTKDKQYFLVGCRLAPYKRVDIVIEAFKKLGPDYHLKIFGDGVDLERLKKLAAGVSQIEKAELYRHAQAFINPQEEDFGITAVESMAAGRPVIAYRRGGATETVLEGKTGIFFDEQTADDIASAVKNFKASDFNPQEIHAWSEKFSVNNFQNQINDFIKNNL